MGRTSVFVMLYTNPDIKGRMTIMKKVISNIMILIGAALLIFVGYTQAKVYLEQKKLRDQYASLSFEVEDGDVENGEEKEIKKGETIGILEIPKLDLSTVLVEGTDPENIKYAVGHLPGSSSVSKVGSKGENFVIAGHRSYTYGKFFNRLDELKNGDEVILKVQKRVLTFEVIDKKIVKPTNMDVVKPVKDKALVTLVTCHPQYSNKQRLIVVTELKNERILDGREVKDIVKNL